jgi:anti-sigma B factor antagonist
VSSISTTSHSGMNGVQVLVVEGELDISSSQDFEAALKPLEEGASTVVIDLRGLDFMDSTGLRAILRSDSRLRSTGKRLALVPGSGPVRRVFRLTGLDSRLEFIEEPSELQSETSKAATDE